MMIKNYLIFIILSQLILLMNKVINVNGQFIPGPRVGQKAVLVGKKLYFIGGRNYNKAVEPLSDLFYYDFEAGLNDTKLVDLRSQQGIELPYVIWHTANIGGADQDSIFIIGGLGVGQLTNTLVYRLDTKTNTISIPIIQGETPPRRKGTDSVSYGGKIYIFSGHMEGDNDVNIYFNNFDILDTVNLVWSVGSLVNAPLPRFLYTATLVNGVIYYIGGIRKGAQGEELNLYILMSEIFLYDIATNTWSFKIALAGGVPDYRIGHSAVLIDDKICIYGGAHNIDGIRNPSKETIVLLDIATLTWSIPQLENINTPKLIDANIPRLVFHTAKLIDNLMFIAFGNSSDTVPRVNNENYYVFSFGQPKIQWFKLAPNKIGNPESSIPNTSSPSGSEKSTTASPVIIGLSTGLTVIGLGTIIAFSLIYYRRTKKNQNPAAGGENGFLGVSNTSANGVILQIPDSSHHSSTPTLTQPQGYLPGQVSTLQQERFSKHSSNYYPGRETPY